MKFLITFTLLFLLQPLFAVTGSFSSNFSLRTTYSSNILNLSDDDLERFSQNKNSEKFELETTDDLLLSPRLEVAWKNHLLAGHTQIIELSCDYEKYLQNKLKDNITLGLSLKQFLSSRFNFTVGYLHYPEIYSNRYKSVLGDESVYRDFTYAKNYYYTRFYYRFKKGISFTYRLGISELFYNEYFTEYDALGWQQRFSCKLSELGFLRMELEYEFKTSSCLGADAFDDPQQISVIKDASYDSNIYDLKFEIPKLLKIYDRNISYRINLEYEQRYFQTDNSEDTYHYARDDHRFSISSRFDIRLNSSLELQFKGSYEERMTDSPSAGVERDKSYDSTELQLNLIYVL